MPLIVRFCNRLDLINWVNVLCLNLLYVKIIVVIIIFGTWFSVQGTTEPRLETRQSDHAFLDFTSKLIKWIYIVSGCSFRCGITHSLSFLPKHAVFLYDFISLIIIIILELSFSAVRWTYPSHAHDIVCTLMTLHQYR